MTPEFTGMLRDAGMRVTRPRLLVLDSLAEHPHAQTAAVLAATLIFTISLVVALGNRRLSTPPTPSLEKTRSLKSPGSVSDCRPVAGSMTSTAPCPTRPASPPPRITATPSTKPRSPIGGCVPPV